MAQHWFQPTAWACGWECAFVKTAAAEPGRWAAEDCIFSQSWQSFAPAATVVAMAQHGVPADRLGVRLGVCFRQDGGG